MKKRVSRIAGMLLLAAAVTFVAFALGHPEWSFPWSNTVTYLLYGLYLALTAVLLIAPLPKKK